MSKESRDMANVQYNENMTGVLFGSDKKRLEANPKFPNVTGNIIVEGVKLRLSGWKRTSKGTGKQFYSLVAEYDKDETRRLSVTSDAVSEKTTGDVTVTKEDLEGLEPTDDDLPF